MLLGRDLRPSEVGTAAVRGGDRDALIVSARDIPLLIGGRVGQAQLDLARTDGAGHEGYARGPQVGHPAQRLAFGIGARHRIHRLGSERRLIGRQRLFQLQQRIGSGIEGNRG